MKRILIGLTTAGAVLGLTLIATNAFFSDVETSSGNTFTAGSLDLKIDSTAHYAGLVCDKDTHVWTGTSLTRLDLVGNSCDGSWVAKDLNGERFFNLADIKPGDSGENTISIEVTNNPAYACAAIYNMIDSENGRTEPEIALNDPDNTTGELSQEIKFFAWADTNGNNIWDSGESILFTNISGPASDVLGGKIYPIALPTPGPITPNTPKFIGLYWCYGTLTATQGVNANPNTLSCSGVGGTNITQSDSLSANIRFYIEQARNNDTFVCPTSLTQ